jgi:hypothetical protein
MSMTATQFSAEAWHDVHFKMSADRKCGSPSNRRLILNRMRSWGIADALTNVFEKLPWLEMFLRENVSAFLLAGEAIFVPHQVR